MTETYNKVKIEVSNKHWCGARCPLLFMRKYCSITLEQREIPLKTSVQFNAIERDYPLRCQTCLDSEYGKTEPDYGG